MAQVYKGVGSGAPSATSSSSGSSRKSLLAPARKKKIPSLICKKSKLHHFDKEGNQWKERSVGTMKLLKHKEMGKILIVMRQSKTLKICANHIVLTTMTVQEHAENDKSCFLQARGFAYGELKD
ncbi:hypothetical protein V6N11_025833 [Hibiscus sabdariffa]|uniref:Uncharacterized protein n=2 Tax=Hibiscus sabdariffa TaxID=183260 RepID=A0ABR2STU2_9ROSI